MPEGQFLGSKSKYVYETDSGEEYVIRRDDTLAALTGTGLVAYDPATNAGASPAPGRFKPRVVFWESTDGQYRKEVICGTVTAELYSSDVAQTLTIDGIAGSTTGRRGEKLSF